MLLTHFKDNDMKKTSNIFFSLILIIFISGCDFSGPEYVLDSNDLDNYYQWKNKITFSSSLKKCNKYFTAVDFHNEADTSSFDNCYAEIFIDVSVHDLERPKFLIAEFKNGKISGKASGMINSLYLAHDGVNKAFRKLYFETEDYENNTIEFKSLNAQDLPCKVQFKLQNNNDQYRIQNTYKRKFICKDFISSFIVIDTSTGTERDGEAKIEYKSGNTWNLSYDSDSLVKATSTDSNGNILFSASYKKLSWSHAYNEPKNTFDLWGGLIDGKGTLTYGDGRTVTITGAKDNGYLMGVITDSNGIKYEGGIYEGLPDGYVEVTDVRGYTKTVAYSKGIEVGWDMMPPKQKDLTDSIDKTYKSIRSASSAQQKQAWIDLNRELCSVNFRYSTSARDWVGYVDEIYMRDNGEIKLTIQMNGIGNKLEISTVGAAFNKKILDLRENTWTQKGSFIKFSGNLIKGLERENECLDKNTLNNSPELKNKTLMFELTSMDVLLS